MIESILDGAILINHAIYTWIKIWFHIILEWVEFCIALTFRMLFFFDRFLRKIFSVSFLTYYFSWLGLGLRESLIGSLILRILVFWSLSIFHFDQDLFDDRHAIRKIGHLLVFEFLFLDEFGHLDIWHSVRFVYVRLSIFVVQILLKIGWDLVILNWALLVIFMIYL
jgi:hypothetical protein